jgi:hypothetical protein
MRTAGVVLALGAAVGTLTACTNPAPVPATSTSSATSSPTPTPTQTPTPTPTAPALQGVALSLSCDQLLSADALYALKGGSNFTSDPNFKPASGSPAAAIALLQGRTCGFVNQTSGEKFNFSVAQLTPTSIAIVKATATSTLGANAIAKSYSPNKNVIGYFTADDEVGHIQIITPKYWIVISSSLYGQADDALDLVTALESSLKV